MAEQDLTEQLPLPQDEQDFVPEPSRMAHRIKVIVGLTVVLGALSFLGFTTFQSATVYFYTVGEIRQIGTTEEGRIVRVNGKLVQDTFVREESSTVARFTLQDTEGTETLSAVHQGVVPDLFFNDHSEIILEGSYSEDGVFHSQNVIVKCPSKYVAAG
jgi:cytochrome c-type biogenesis protein CcmE